MTDIINDGIILKHFKNEFSALDSLDFTKDMQGIQGLINQMELPKYDVTNVTCRLKKIQKWRRQLKKLKKIPFVKQRTIEWLELRKDRLTASDLYDAIKEGASQLQLAKKKANIVADTTNYNMIAPLKWGTMFEPMASRCYSQANHDITLHDFGLICDSQNKHFGASPDGINDLGIMVEIKCPYSRKIIDDFVPVKYRLQIQGQLAVCGLEECDYIECEFKTLENEEEYLSNVSDKSKINHGIIAEYCIDNKEYTYLYSEPYLTTEEAIQDILTQTSKKPEISKLIYWVLVKMNVQKVYFDAEEWKIIEPKIHNFWEKVEEYRSLSPEEIEELCKPKPKKKIQFVQDDD